MLGMAVPEGTVTPGVVEREVLESDSIIADEDPVPRRLPVTLTTSEDELLGK
jgi:hypothetical protein